jgi:hypothetical protein
MAGTDGVAETVEEFRRLRHNSLASLGVRMKTRIYSV